MARRIRHFSAIFKELYWGFRWKIGGLILLGFAGSVLDALSIGILVPLFSFVLRDGAVEGDAISKAVFGMFDFLAVQLSLTTLLVAASLLFVIKAVAGWSFDYARTRLAGSFLAESRTALYRDLLGAKWPYLTSQRIGYLDNLFMVDLKNAMGVFKATVSIIAAGAAFVAYLLVALALSPMVTAATLGVGFLMLLLTQSIFGKARRYSRRAVELRKVIAHFVNESILGLKVIKTTGTEGRVAAMGSDLFEESKRLSIRIFMAQSPTVVVEPLSVIFIAIVFGISYRADPNLNIAAFLAIMFLVQRIFDFVKRIQSNLLAMNADIPPAERVVAFKREIAAHADRSGGELPFRFRGVLTFRDVSFSYRPDRPVLDSVSFAVRRGEIAAVIGRTGEGKTTIADLVLRLLTPTRGALLLDGKSIHEIALAEWRRCVGYVSQDIVLVNDSVMANIKFFDERITDGEAIEAARRAHVSDVIARLPKGFATNVGERGILLSGGQRQRIALARAFARNPELLILDEATSALDSESEAAIREALAERRGDLTVLIISHRISFIRDADAVFVLESGRIVERGTPHALLADAGSYLSKVSQLA